MQFSESIQNRDYLSTERWSIACFLFCFLFFLFFDLVSSFLLKIDLDLGLGVSTATEISSIEKSLPFSHYDNRKKR